MLAIFLSWSLMPFPETEVRIGAMWMYTRGALQRTCVREIEYYSVERHAFEVLVFLELRGINFIENSGIHLCIVGFDKKAASRCIYLS